MTGRKIISLLVLLSIGLGLFGCKPRAEDGPRVYASCTIIGQPQEAELDVGAVDFSAIAYVQLLVISPAQRFRGGGPGLGNPNWFEQYLIRALPDHEIEVAFVITPVDGPIFEDSAFTTCN
jgi:hypothetical protein